MHFAGEKDHKKFLGVTLDDPITKKRDRNYNPNIENKKNLKTGENVKVLKKEEEEKSSSESHN